MVLYENRNRNILEAEWVEINRPLENSIMGLHLSLKEKGNKTGLMLPGTVFLGKAERAQTMCVSTGLRFPRTSALTGEPDSPLYLALCSVEHWINSTSNTLARYSRRALERVAIGLFSRKPRPCALRGFRRIRTTNWNQCLGIYFKSHLPFQWRTRPSAPSPACPAA